MNLTTLHLTNYFISDFLFQPYKITHYKLCISDLTFIYDLTILHITLKLFWNCFFSVLQNYTLLQTVCFRSKYFVCTLQCYTLQTVFFRFSFLTLQYYILLYNIFEEKNSQHYKITHYFRLFVFYLNILFKPYNVTPYKLFSSDFLF